MARRSIHQLTVLMILVFAASAGPVAAQSSASYKLQETSINNGGHPKNGVVLVSNDYHITLDAIGDGIVRVGLTGSFYHVDGGFLSSYSPPGVVSGVRFNDATTLQWNAEPSAGMYQVYRGTSLPGTYGTCFASSLTATSTADGSIPSVGGSFFYFVTVRNRLSEEGSKGNASNGAVRPNSSPCP
jgi:hypothetical protein